MTINQGLCINVKNEIKKWTNMSAGTFLFHSSKDLDALLSSYSRNLIPSTFSAWGPYKGTLVEVQYQMFILNNTTLYVHCIIYIWLLCTNHLLQWVVKSAFDYLHDGHDYFVEIHVYISVCHYFCWFVFFSHKDLPD